MGIKRWGVSERDRLQSIAPAVHFFSGTLISSRWLKVRRSTLIPDGRDLVVAGEMPTCMKNPGSLTSNSCWRRTDDRTRNHAPAVGSSRGVCPDASSGRSRRGPQTMTVHRRPRGRRAGRVPDQAMAGPRPPGPPIIAALDTNRDGEISARTRFCTAAGCPQYTRPQSRRKTRPVRA